MLFSALLLTNAAVKDTILGTLMSSLVGGLGLCADPAQVKPGSSLPLLINALGLEDLANREPWSGPGLTLSVAY